MGLWAALLSGAVEFCSTGRFVSGAGWRHMRRTLDSTELVFVRRGVLPMIVGGQRLDIASGEVALWPAGVEHAGAETIREDLEFHWMHFRLPQMRHLADSAALPADEHNLILPDHARLADPDRVVVLANQLLDLYVAHGPHANAYCDYALTSLLLEVSAQIRQSLRQSQRTGETGSIIRFNEGVGKVITGGFREGMAADAIDEPGLAVMQGVRSWIRANAFDDITVAAVARRFHYSPSYLTALYKRVFGIGIVEQVTECRIDRARELLSSTSLPMADIAHEVGYSDPKYFLRVFKRRIGLTPSQYRASFSGKLFNTV
ncbi:helix-turn-helix domain-containing protein [Bifidobacterium oedipodis]|nr:AraC family transcriptional regulator [Bifidobacterium sp. DSM 109957]